MDDRMARIRNALDAVKQRTAATETERDQLREQLETIQSRISALGGIDAAEAIAAWKAEAIAKIDTLPSITRATVKKLLGL